MKSFILSLLAASALAVPAVEAWHSTTTTSSTHKSTSTTSLKPTSTTSSKRTTSTTSTTHSTSSSSTKISSTSSKTSSTSSKTSSTSSKTSSTSSKTSSTSSSCPTSTLQSFYVNYNFESLNNGGLTPAAIVSVGEYDLLSFSNFAVVDDTLSQTGTQVAGVFPATPPNMIAFNPIISLQESLDANAPASVSIYYTESIINYFTAYQFYYGCVLASQENEASLPQSCNITAQGYNTAGALVATQVFNFNVPLLTVEMNMTKGVFSSAFQNLAVLNFTVATDVPLVDNTTTAGLMDNLVAQLYQVGSNAFYP